MTTITATTTTTAMTITKRPSIKTKFIYKETVKLKVMRKRRCGANKISKDVHIDNNIEGINAHIHWQQSQFQQKQKLA